LLTEEPEFGDFSLLLTDVMTIADECDSQPRQTLISFMGQVAKIAE
jgi:hypothetical protein